ncbi:hypothetical protein AMTRI_Chr09g17230 [Amborella trichopoda]
MFSGFFYFHFLFTLIFPIFSIFNHFVNYLISSSGLTGQPIWLCRFNQTGVLTGLVTGPVLRTLILIERSRQRFEGLELNHKCARKLVATVIWWVRHQNAFSAFFTMNLLQNWLAISRLTAMDIPQAMHWFPLEP